MSRRNNPEEQLQRTIVEWLRWTKPDCVWFFVNNGARLSKAQAGIAKAMGVLPGVADLVFVLPGGRVGFIEVKAPGKHLSIAQKAFAASVEKLGAQYDQAWSIGDVQDIFKTWGVTFGQARGRAA